jgi:hypothetical protein
LAGAAMLHDVLSRAPATDAAAEAAMKAKRATASPDEDEDGEGRHARGKRQQLLGLGPAALSQLMLLASKGSGEKSPDAAAGGSEDGSGERMLGWRAGPSIAARVPSSLLSSGGPALPPDMCVSIFYFPHKLSLVLSTKCSIANLNAHSHIYFLCLTTCPAIPSTIIITSDLRWS